MPKAITSHRCQVPNDLTNHQESVRVFPASAFADQWSGGQRHGEGSGGAPAFGNCGLDMGTGHQRNGWIEHKRLCNKSLVPNLHQHKCHASIDELDTRHRPVCSFPVANPIRGANIRSQRRTKLLCREDMQCEGPKPFFKRGSLRPRRGPIRLEHRSVEPPPMPLQIIQKR